MANDKATVNHTYEDWYKCIMSYERSYKRWEARVDRIVKKYKDDAIKGLFVGKTDVSLNDMWKQTPQNTSRGRI